MNGGNGGLNTKLDVVGGKKWNRWSIQMCVIFGAQDALEIVNDGYTLVAKITTEAQSNMQWEMRKKDQKTLFYIHQCMNMKVFENIVKIQ